ncbi:hypothetical protein MMC30_006842 [Trapelia coarctata]|nr:hypothetical protein [Trapelia coarctata]
MAGRANAYSTFVKAAPEFGDGGSRASNHGGTSNLAGMVRHPLHSILALHMDISKGPISPGSYNPLGAVAVHPSCGPMLKVKSYSDYYSDGSSKPYWVGLGAGTFNVTFELKHSYQRSNYSMVSGSFQPSKDSCPLALDSSVYERVANYLVNETGLEILAPTTFWEEDGMQANKTIFALLLSELHANTSLFNDKKPLIDLKVLEQRSTSSCSSSFLSGNGAMYTGEYWEPDYPVNFFPLYQFLSSGLLTVWGLMLLLRLTPLGAF